MNDAFQQLTLDLVDTQNENLRAGLANVQSGLAETVALNATTAREFQRIESEFAGLVDSSRSIAADLESLNADVSGASEKTRAVSALIGEIGKLLGSIVDVSDQTKLLALNATLEAARAGEAGRGFAVVANEVKDLSLQVRKSADQISAAIRQIDRQSGELNEAMSHSTELCTEVMATVGGFHERLAGTGEANRRAMQNVYASNDRIFMSLAKLDHVLWKVNTYLSLLRRKEQFTFVDHRNCRLGKWYLEGEGKQSFADMPSYHDLDAPHAQVHEGTRRVLQMLHDDDIARHSGELRRAIDEMERGSQAVFQILDRMMGEKDQRR